MAVVKASWRLSRLDMKLFTSRASSLLETSSAAFLIAAAFAIAASAAFLTLCAAFAVAVSSASDSVVPSVEPVGLPDSQSAVLD